MRLWKCRKNKLWYFLDLVRSMLESIFSLSLWNQVGFRLEYCPTLSKLERTFLIDRWCRLSGYLKHQAISAFATERIAWTIEFGCGKYRVLLICSGWLWSKLAHCNWHSTNEDSHRFLVRTNSPLHNLICLGLEDFQVDLTKELMVVLIILIPIAWL